MVKRTTNNHYLYLSIAGFVLRVSIVNNSSSFYAKFWKNYLTDRYALWLVKRRQHNVTLRFSTDESIELAGKKSGRTFYSKIYQKVNSRNYQTYHYISYYQLQYVLQNIISDLLSKNRGLFVHASSCLISKDTACVFSGKSTSGKSTITNLLADSYPKLADDLLVVRVEGKSLYLYLLPLERKDIYTKDSGMKFKISHFLFLQKEGRKPRRLNQRKKRKWARQKPRHVKASPPE